jgi:hypothetical protein
MTELIFPTSAQVPKSKHHCHKLQIEHVPSSSAAIYCKYLSAVTRASLYIRMRRKIGATSKITALTC